MNIYRKTSIVGISSLGFDHTTVLGNTLQEIAWQKSGIMKPNSVTIIANDQPKETHKILIERSVEKKASKLCPLFLHLNKLFTEILFIQINQHFVSPTTILTT